MKPLLIIVLSTTFNVNSAIPTNNPYCTEPSINAIVVEPTLLTAIAKRIPAIAKQRVEPTQRTTFDVALSEGAFISTKTKLSTPNTTARYKRRSATIINRTGEPMVCPDTSPIRPPQFKESRVFNVKSSKDILVAPLLTKGSVSE